MIEREVVITGMGLITPLGRGVEENRANLEANKTGIAHYPKDGQPNFFQYLGKVDKFEIPQPIPHKLQGEMRFLNRGSLLGFASAYEAVLKSTAKISDTPPGRRALYIASGDFTKVGCDFMYPATKEASEGKWQKLDFEKLNIATLDQVNPFFLLESISNNLFSFLSAFFEFKGPNTSLASLSPYGSMALELAFRSIKQNRADIALAVGCGNWITEIPLYELEGLGILSKCSSGARSFRPFDRSRDGFIPGEGGAALFLEGSEIAANRGAPILGRIRGTGNCIEFSPGQGLSAPLKVHKRSIGLATQDASCGVEDLAFICAHGSATQKGDRSELSSIQDVLKTEKAKVPVCGLKPYTGHIGAASDIAEIILGITALKQRFVPATPNFNETDKEFSLLNISDHHQPCEKDSFLSLSYGMGGQSSSIIVSTR